MARLFCAAWSKTSKRLSQATVGRLLAYEWPGNVRELKNCMQRACILSPGDWILPEHLPPRVAAKEGGSTAPAPPGGEGGEEPLEEVEKRAILEAVRKCGGNKSKAARELGISRKKLTYERKE